METLSRRFSSLLLIILVCGCAVAPKVAGPFGNQLSRSDVAEIRRLMIIGREGGRPEITIDAVAPNKATVTAANLRTFEKPPQPMSHVSETFTVIKRNGKWTAEGGVEVKKTPVVN